MKLTHIKALKCRKFKSSSTMRLLKQFAFYSFLILLNYSCAEIISVPDISKDNVNILAPADGLELEDNLVRFTWEAVDFADQYQFQLATPNFENAIQVVVDTIIGEPGLPVSNINLRLENQEYEWRIRALNSAYETAYSTRFLSINDPTVSFSEQQIVLVSPEDGFETQDTLINLEWEAVDEALVYRVLITNSSDNSICLETSTDETQIEIDFVPGNYKWAVRAENEFLHTAFSERSLTILE